MKKFVQIIESISDYASGHFSGWLIISMMILVVVEVVSRYSLHQALGIADEFSAYLLVAISFMGLAYVARTRGHIRITFIFSRLPLKVRQWLRLVTLLLGLAFYIVLGMACKNLITWSFLNHARSTSWLRVPVVIPQIFMGIGVALICLQLIVDIMSAVKTIRAGETTGETI